jgi:hypothetical protein
MHELTESMCWILERSPDVFEGKCLKLSEGEQDVSGKITDLS